MSSDKSDSEDVLRAIDELGARAAHTDLEARQVLDEAGVDPDALVRAVRDEVAAMLAVNRPVPARTDAIRNWLLAALAASAAGFVVSYHVNARASAEVQRQTARAQLVGPLLSGLSSDDPARRSLALVVARQVDPEFASRTAIQIGQWEVSSQAQARASRNAAYAERFLSGLQKLQISRDPDDRKVAIWNDLLPVLLEARKNRDEFVDVAIEYQRVLPLLEVRDPGVFLDSYWGELWILTILLDSKIVPVVEAARRQAPEPAAVEQVFRKNAPALPERDRRAFEEAKTVYVRAIAGIPATR